MFVRLLVHAFPLVVAAAVALGQWSADWRIVPGLLVGWFLADAASGLLHMLMDYLPCRADIGWGGLYDYAGSRESEHYRQLKAATMRRAGPIERLLFDFKVHHPRPDALGRRGLYHQIWSTILFLSLPLTLLLVVAELIWPVPGWIVAGAIAFVLGGTFSQYFHGSLHRADVPWFVRAMRRAGLLMTPAAHERHHASLQRDFATISGWSNPPLNLLFRTLRARGWLGDEGLVPH